MSRIKGRYVSGTFIEAARWLDKATGTLFSNEHTTQPSHSKFTPRSDGAWVRGDCVWKPDAATTQWFVHMHNVTNQLGPYFTDGPYTEQGARSKAADGAARYPSNTYAVYQVLPGNTVKVVPPTPPQPEVIWS